MVLRTLWSKVKSRLQWEEFKQKFSEKPEMEVHIYFAPKIIVMWRLDFVPITFPIWYIEFKSWKSKFKICWGRVPLVEQDLLVLPEHLSTSQFLVGVHFAWSLVFCQVLSTSLYVLFLLVIVLSVLWFTASDYILVSSNFSLDRQWCSLQGERYRLIWISSFL